MRALLLLLAGSLLAGCGSRCSASSCAGCCDSNGDCAAGTTRDFCGSNGSACQVCTHYAECIIGQCLEPGTISGPTSVDFGTVGAQTMSSQSITLTNSGDLPLQISKAMISGGDAHAFSVEPVPDAPVDPSKSIVVTFDFAPGGFGFFSTSVGLVSNAANSTYWIYLSGTGT